MLSSARASAARLRIRGVWQRVMLAVAGPIVFFCALEVGLRLSGFGRSMDFFIPDEKPGYYRTNPAFTGLFLPENFGIRPLNFRLPRAKPPGGLRVFVLGESAAQGTPEPGLGFAAQLEAQLRAHFGQRPIEVYNLGITAINSHVVYEIARQLPEFSPDIVVVYMGNNEVIGPYGPGSVYLPTMPPRWLIRASVELRRSRTGQLILRLAAKLRVRRNAPLEWRGMETFAGSSIRGDDPRLETVYRNFEENLRGIISIATAAGAKVIVSTVVANLKDSSPFLSVHRKGMAADEVAAWSRAFEEGLARWQLDEPRRAESALREALRLDPQYADTSFLLGRLALARGDTENARRLFQDALHWDALRFRPDARLNALVRAVADEAGGAVQLVDAARELGADPTSVGPISGREILFEHVHLNWNGNAELARRLAAACVQASEGSAVNGTFLTSAECATALGYTDYAKETVLEKMAMMTSKAPFTNQITYREEQDYFRREIVATHASVATPDRLAAAAEAAGAARRRDPRDPLLSDRLAFIEADFGHLDRAAQLLDDAAALQPASALLMARKANLLLMQQKTAEAEALLLRAAKEDPYYFPTWKVLVDIWTGTHRIDDGKRVLAQASTAMPGNNYVAMATAMLLQQSGDATGAEARWREILRRDPANPTALEEIVALCDARKDSEAAVAVMLQASKAQTRNYANNARLAQAFAERHDEAKEAFYLRALVESGPVDSGLYVGLARLLAHLGRPLDAAVYAHRGALAAAEEGDTATAQEAENLQGLLGQN